MDTRPPGPVELHLLRHADAGDPLAWPGPDAERPLTKRGMRQAERLAGLLLAAGFEPDVLVSSPYRRATQTARRLGTALGLEVVVDDRLAGRLDLPTVDGLLDDLGRPGRPVLVGHDPDFSTLVAVLCASEGVPVPKGALVRIDAPRPLEAGAGVLRWLIPPDALKVRPRHRS
ncbi:MAG: SixA phosphatase family protein [Candidatus Limnocylindrales bacterium]